MKSLGYWYLLAEPAVASAHRVQPLLPRQTTFSNSSTATVTGSPTAVSLAPCCWVVAGQVAVALNRWYSSVAEDVVATVITTYIRENNSSAIPVNSTTLYVPKNGTMIFPEPGLYTAGNIATSPWVTIPGIPTNILGGDLTAPNDYDGTAVDTATVQAFASTTLQIASPTPYDEWFKLGIYTATPTAGWDDVPATGVDEWRSDMCGTWSYNTRVVASSTVITSGAATFTSTTTFPFTLTESLFLPKDSVGTTTFDGHDPIGQFHATVLSNVTYIKPRETALPDLDWRLPLPSEVVPWLETQESVVAKYPFIGQCWVLDGQGQPVVHVPVNQLTVTSAKIIDVTHSGVATTFSKTTIAATAHTEVSDTSLEVPSPTTRTSGGTADPINPPPTTTTGSTQAPGGTGTGGSVNQPPGQDPADTPAPTPTTAVGQGPTQGGNQEDTPSPGNPAVGATTISTGGLGALISAINSISDQQQTTLIQQAPAAGGMTSRPAAVVPAQSPVNSVTGFVIGTQTGSPGGSVITAGGSTFSALPSGSGVQVVAAGKTSTLPVAAAPGPSNGPSPSVVGPFVVTGQTLTAGGDAVTSGNAVFTALPSGQGIQVVSNGETRTLRTGGNAAAGDGYPTIIAGQTLSVGGDAITSGDAIFSALPSGQGIQVVSSGETSTIQPTPSIERLGSSVFLIGDQSFSAGGRAVVDQGTTYFAMLFGSGVLVGANGATSTVSVGAGDLTPRPVIIPAQDSELVTLGDQVYTAYAAGTSLLVIGGQTLSIGGTAVIDGETVYLSGTNLIVASGTATSTEGLGGAIISGIGGGSGTATTSPALQTASAASLAAVPGILAVLVAAFVLSMVVI